jgi:nucleoside-diphosphate-sugar epimerase
MLELGKVFVIRSSGFIGQKLCRRLLEFGVVVVDVLVSILLHIVASAGTIVGNRSN